MSETPDYMTEIEVVATGLQRQVVDLHSELVLAWKSFEEYADREMKHDILAVVASTQLRMHGRTLIRLLYRAGDANADLDVAQLREKNAAYGGSWCSRGGRGAFFTLARKWDRYLEQHRLGNTDTEDSTGDLRRYLILVEAWHVARESAERAKPKNGLELAGDAVLKQLKLCTRPGCGHVESIHEPKNLGNTERPVFKYGPCKSVNCGCTGYAEQMKLEAVTGFDPTKTF